MGKCVGCGVNLIRAPEDHDRPGRPGKCNYCRIAELERWQREACEALGAARGFMPVAWNDETRRLLGEAGRGTA